MTNRPDLTSVVLESCCLKSIEAINYKLKATNWLQFAFLPTIFASMFVSPTNPSGQGGALTTISAIAQADWVNLTRAAAQIPSLPRRSIQQICFSETLKHRGKLSDFWRAMYESFS